ncbi:D-serine dehydratase [compost metagenome]
MPGPWRVTADTEWLAAQGLNEQQMKNATHLVWATGGGMVPEAEMAKYLANARQSI